MDGRAGAGELDSTPGELPGQPRQGLPSVESTKPSCELLPVTRLVCGTGLATRQEAGRSARSRRGCTRGGAARFIHDSNQSTATAQSRSQKKTKRSFAALVPRQGLSCLSCVRGGIAREWRVDEEFAVCQVDRRTFTPSHLFAHTRILKARPAALRWVGACCRAQGRSPPWLCPPLCFHRRPLAQSTTRRNGTNSSLLHLSQFLNPCKISTRSARHVSCSRVPCAGRLATNAASHQPPWSRGRAGTCS